MEFKAQAINVKFTDTGQAVIELTAPDTQAIRKNVSELKTIVAEGKELAAEIKQYRKKRSLDANSYAWVLISKIADAINSSKEEVYIAMLKRYGQHEPQLLSVVSEAAGMIYRATQNHCQEVGESELNGKTFKHFRILIGSSQYDSKDMATLIDGVVSECKELGIETMKPEELEAMKNAWGKNGG